MIDYNFRDRDEKAGDKWLLVYLQGILIAVCLVAGVVLGLAM